MAMIETSLYRHFDADGALLYVGISIHPTRRFGEHSAAQWIGAVSRTEIEKFPSRDGAALAEKVAIQTERPKYNVIYSDENKARGGVVFDAERLRAALGLSVAAIAQLVGVTRAGWYKAERTGIVSPPLARLLAYIEIYGVGLAKEMMEERDDDGK